jgi:MFS family permease
MIIIAAGFSYACYSIALGFINGFVPLVSSFTKAEVTAANTVLLVVDFALLPVFGYLAQKWSREKLMMSAAAAALLSGYPIFILLPGSGLATIMLLRTLLVAVGVAFAATYHAWAQSLVPAEDRFTVCAVAYALGCQLLGGFTGSLSLWLYSITGDPSAAAWYWMFLGLAAALAVWRSQAFVPNAPLARSHANASQNSAGLRTHPEA